MVGAATFPGQEGKELSVHAGSFVTLECHARIHEPSCISFYVQRDAVANPGTNEADGLTLFKHLYNVV
jgi:hypothetical protein